MTLEQGVTSCQRRDIERLRVTEGGVEACTFRYAESACSNKRGGPLFEEFLPLFPASTVPGRVHPIQITNRDLEIICAVAKNRLCIRLILTASSVKVNSSLCAGFSVLP